jgi:hypothetical protein
MPSIFQTFKQPHSEGIEGYFAAKYKETHRIKLDELSMFIWLQKLTSPST